MKTNGKHPRARARALPSGRDEITVSSFLPGVHPDDLWFHVGTAQGINEELAPLLHMRRPKDATWSRLTDVPVGEPAGRCDVLLFGVLPVDYDDLKLAEVRSGTYFREESSMRTMRLWGHERTVTGEDGGTRVHDRILLEVNPRLTRTRPAHRWVVKLLFEHRHRRLRNLIGPRLALPTAGSAT